MKEKIIKLIILILISSGLFYWFEWRPSKITMKCSNESKESAIKKQNANGNYSPENRDYYFKFCLQENGISK